MSSKTKGAVSKQSPPGGNESSNGRGGFVKALIIAGTFFAIVVISVVARGPGDSWPSAGVVTIRIGLLSLFTLVYFLMLNRTQTARAGEKGKQRTRKK